MTVLLSALRTELPGYAGPISPSISCRLQRGRLLPRAEDPPCGVPLGPPPHYGEWLSLGNSRGTAETSASGLALRNEMVLSGQHCSETHLTS